MGLLKLIIKAIAKPVINNHNGKVGEKIVSSKLNPIWFGKVEHRLLNDVIIIDDNNKTHQIDHIEIRSNGIFCIETKNYKGLILGGENQDKWTQVLYNGKKYQLLNPLKQNRSHVYHLNKLLKNKYKINSVVVMVQNNADKINVSNVVNLDDLKKYLNNFYDGTSYSVEEMGEIYNSILRSVGDITNREHVKNIRNTQKDLKNGICPRCGGKLVERNGKYGKFYGCSSYPNCRFVLNDK